MLPPRETNQSCDHTPKSKTDPPSLLSLPVELRELIYSFLFSSYTIRHGFHHASIPGSTDDTPTRIALLLTCRQIFNEAWRHLPLNCVFHFRGTEDLLDTLLSVDQSIVTRVRHVRVRAFPFPLYTSSGTDYYPTYHAANALTLLPGLCLDSLVVEDCWHGFGMGDGWRDATTYFDIEALLQTNGWKTLTYITPSTDFLVSAHDPRQKRLPQPATWNALLENRDGKHSGASVHMTILPYQSQTPTPTPDQSTKNTDAMLPWSAVPGHTLVENKHLAPPSQSLKGKVYIIAHRAPRISPVQTGLTQHTPWKKLKGRPTDFAPHDWSPYYNDMADAIAWIYGGWGRRAHLADQALST